MSGRLQKEASALGRSCVHCGFCLASCPTFQVLGDERDSPRGRIDFIRAAAQGEPARKKSLAHLDRCLTCLACEAVCPSGVRYGELVALGREMLERARPWHERLVRQCLHGVLVNPKLFDPLLRLGRWLSPFLPRAVASRIPPCRHAWPPKRLWPKAEGQPGLVLFSGCVQDPLIPAIHEAAAELFQALGHLVRKTPRLCCGALAAHLGRHGEARRHALAVVDHLFPEAEKGVPCVVNASGCLAHLHRLPFWLRDDPRAAARAAVVVSMLKEPAALLQGRVRKRQDAPEVVALHEPCTLQHGLQGHLQGHLLVRSLLADAGFSLRLPEEPGMCCGAAGPYAFLERRLAKTLQERKAEYLDATQAPLVVSANIGCIIHLAEKAKTPVRHYLEVIEPAANS